MSSTRVVIGSPWVLDQQMERSDKLPGSRSLADAFLADAFDPAELRERLRRIRPVAPTLAEELEVARGHATRLCAQNRRVLEEVRRLQKQRGQEGGRKDKDRA